MQKYEANKLLQDDDELQVQVCSKNCRYFISLDKSYVYLHGPGVKLMSEYDGIEQIVGMADPEDIAVLVVLLFENGLWPEE